MKEPGFWLRGREWLSGMCQQISISLLIVRSFLLAALLAFHIGCCSAQDCKPDDFTSIDNLEASVRRVIEEHGYTGWDDKIFGRSGDLTALALLKVYSIADLTRPEMIPQVLTILRLSFSCISRCVESCSNREPRLTSLLLEYLHEHSSGHLREQVEDTEKFVQQQSPNLQIPH